MYRVLIVEDTPAEAEVLRARLAHYGQERGLRFEIEVLGTAFEFVEARPEADLIFMDIDLPGISGMEAAEALRAYDEVTPLIFVTNLARYAVRGYAVQALDFVVKPVAYGEFCLCMDRAMRVLECLPGRTVAVRARDGLHMVDLSDILYVDLRGHDVCCHVAGASEPLRFRGTIKAVEAELDAGLFVRVNSGCLVNMGQVERIGADSVTMADGAELFFSRPQRKRALEALTNYVCGAR